MVFTYKYIKRKWIQIKQKYYMNMDFREIKTLKCEAIIEGIPTSEQSKVHAL